MTDNKANHQGRNTAVLIVVVLVIVAILAIVNSNKSGTTPSATKLSLYSQNGTLVSSNGPRMPSGWTLEPAGKQVQTQAQPDGISLSPNGKNLYVVSSGQWDEDLGVINTSSLKISNAPAESSFMGVQEDSNGNIYVAGGGKNMVYVYKDNGNSTATAPANSYNSAIPPLAKPNGIQTPGYPSNMIIDKNNGWLYVAGNLSIPQSEINQDDPNAGNCPNASDNLISPTNSANPSSCSVIVGIDIAQLNQSTLTAPEVLIPVGQDAYGIVFNPTDNMMYVSNWADGSITSRGINQNGTVSVVKINQNGTGQEIQNVLVGQQPTGIALSPNGTELAVSNTMSDSVSLIGLKSNGTASSVKSYPVGMSLKGISGSQPVAVQFSPDGTKLFAALFGMNEVEVLNSNGTAIPQTVNYSLSGTSKNSTVIPETLIPVGWMPIAMTVGPNPTGSGFRLYVSNYQGMGAGPGFYFPASDSVGNSAVQGTISVIDMNPDPASQLNLYTAQAVSADDLLPIFNSGISSPETNPCLPTPNPNGTTSYSSLICAASKNTVSRKDLHIVIILRENKTVDSMLGYLGGQLKMTASQQYQTYGPDITPNLANIALKFGMNDNNYVAGDESGTGHEMLTGGMFLLTTELFVHVDNDFGLRGNRNNDPINQVDNTHTRLADEMYNAGYSELTYGGDLNSNSPAQANDIPAAIWGNASSNVFAGTNTDYPDTNRAGIFDSGATVDYGWDTLNSTEPPPDFGKQIGLCGGPTGFCDYPGASSTDYSKYSVAGWTQSYNTCIQKGKSNAICQEAMPSLSILEVPDDHTDVFNDGNNPMMWSPQNQVANNDYATGQIVQTLSKSPFWKDTLVMIIEDDTQFTGDSINALRSYIVTAGGLAKSLGPNKEVSNQVSSFCAIDKTVEDIFALKPMGVCDATSMPLDSIVANSIPTHSVPSYTAVVPTVPPLNPYPTVGSERLKPWCAANAPNGIGYYGMLHNQFVECLGSFIGSAALSINVNNL
jgi:DNA-binding beta-propeller fold protein YncE